MLNSATRDRIPNTTQKTKQPDGLPLSPEWSRGSGTETSNRSSELCLGRKDPPAATPALCYPSVLSPPPHVNKKEKNSMKTMNTKLTSGAARKAHRTKDGIPKYTDNPGGRKFTWRDREEDWSEDALRKGGVPDRDDDKGDVIASVDLTNRVKKHKRSRSLGDNPQTIEGSEFSITAMVADADERDFRRPKMRRATSKPSLHESSGPLLSSTIDFDESEGDPNDNEELYFLRGGKNKSESLKESFKKRGANGQGNVNNRNKNNQARRGRRNDKFDEQRDLQDNGEFISPVQNNDGSFPSNKNFTIPTDGEMLVDASYNSPIISSSRRGKFLTNWADMTIGSDLTINSEGRAGGPKRKTRRGRKKKKNQSMSFSDTSITSSFKATLQGDADESFDMDRGQSQRFSGTLRSGRGTEDREQGSLEALPALEVNRANGSNRDEDRGARRAPDRTGGTGGASRQKQPRFKIHQ